MTDKTMPPLPSGSVDLDALHRADAKGGDLAKAVETATTRKAPPPSDEADEPEFDVPFSYTVSAKRGGWFEISGTCSSRASACARRISSARHSETPM